MHTFALIGVVGGQHRVERTVEVALRLCGQQIVLGVQGHLDVGLVPLLHEDALQCRVLGGSLPVGLPQQDGVHHPPCLFVEGQVGPLGILDAVPAQQDFHLCGQPNALGLAHHLPPDQRTRLPHPLTGGRTSCQTVGQHCEQDAVVAQTIAGIQPIGGVELAADAALIPLIGVVIPDGQLRQIGPHTSLHSVHSFRGPRRAQPFLQGKTASPQL